MNFQITEAPMKLIAIGMKIIALAKLPQRTASVSCAASSPKKVEAAGTISSHSMLLAIDSLELSVLEQPDVVIKAHETAAPRRRGPNTRST